MQPPRETKRVLDWQNEDDEEGVRSLLYEYSSNGETSANDLYERPTSPQREQRVVNITPRIISSQHALWQRHKKRNETDEGKDLTQEPRNDLTESIMDEVEERPAPMREGINEIRMNFDALMERMKPEEEEKTESKETARG